MVTSLGDWPGELLLTFIGGRLAVLETATDAVRTAVGARVGMSFDQVDRLYHGAGRLLTTADGGPAYLVRYGPLVMVFGDHPIRPGVGAITTGPARIVLPDLGIPAGDRRVAFPCGHPSYGRRPCRLTGLVPTSGPLACPLDNEGDPDLAAVPARGLRSGGDAGQLRALPDDLHGAGRHAARTVRHRAALWRRQPGGLGHAAGRLTVPGPARPVTARRSPR
ncbi:hypothetical protein GCM10020358_29480 [Amorphoplanes nipponensis]|uniref:hypothetical protein n=1 Tax=Actinoplanes nipponensis TaxID=135950 RepID=UPI0031F00B29